MLGELDLSTMQAVRLKGRPLPADVASAANASQTEVEGRLTELVCQGLLVEKNQRFRLKPEGKDALTAALSEERSVIDVGALRQIYQDFTPINADFKLMVTDWQHRDGQPNDHTDQDYDASVLQRLDDGDGRFRPMIDSYHTVWFEFHEELIQLSGLFRAEEAAAGRAE